MCACIPNDSSTGKAINPAVSHKPLITEKYINNSKINGQ